MRFTIAGGALVALALTVACQDPTATSSQKSTLAPRAGNTLSGVTTFSVDRASALIAGHTADAATIDPGRAIDPNNYVCVNGSPIIDWYVASLNDIQAAVPGLWQYMYFNLSADLAVLFEPAFFESSATPQTYGFTGAFTNVMQRTERDVKAFWDIPSSDIQVLAAHGRIIQNPAKMTLMYEQILGAPHATAVGIANQLNSFAHVYPVLNGGDHPFFTLNAFAIWQIGGGIPDKIVMGDAILEGFKAVGLGDVAPQAIFAHEFAHQIQNRRAYYNDPFANAGSAAEQTRYMELMADAFAGYYLTHKRGAAMNKFRVEEFLQAFFQLGDCAFSDPGHHGTPNQRMKSSRFGFDVAAAALKQGQILTANQFHALFVAYYPTLIAPDAS